MSSEQDDPGMARVGEAVGLGHAGDADGASPTCTAGSDTRTWPLTTWSRPVRRSARSPTTGTAG